ncbi:hypothetical protein J3U21_08780 [Gilliamella sp. B2776]|uniref:hypothetical protein n=1 Tax=unclassified Gilliamella TaxID=2685620 RepID=UPI002269EE0D|nr:MULTISPECIES: hypothetical protein [unclassified Gilliamella]MCX8649527.1 hypothetical protein [Gilliamella sp. B2779]MCX8654571.1 hypothetical protein [Gilliamella sp. B2737]MCX8656443.1 hypothetical protein [Gilliamella sp. B2894]MCX8664961.1 hypothetical protein [Gilliamella sp. B2887]MCX8692246.1 hypothetical protein [Gilliamella sp. B2776]
MNKLSITFSLPTTAKPSVIWQYYVDLNLRKLWETDLEDFYVNDGLISGAKGIFKLENMPEMEFTLSKVLENKEFTEEFNMPDIGLLSFSHQIIEVEPNQYNLKSEISLKPVDELDDKLAYDFLKQISDDIIDKTFSLKNLVER